MNKAEINKLVYNAWAERFPPTIMADLLKLSDEEVIVMYCDLDDEFDFPFH